MEDLKDNYYHTDDTPHAVSNKAKHLCEFNRLAVDRDGSS